MGQPAPHVLSKMLGMGPACTKCAVEDAGYGLACTNCAVEGAGYGPACTKCAVEDAGRSLIVCSQ
jgi:hypothetical protein